MAILLLIALLLFFGAMIWALLLAVYGRDLL